MFRMPSELADRELRNKIFGVCIGIVTDNKDPDGFYRVKVKYPWLPNSDQEQSFWLRVATVGAGKERGFFNLPEPDDEVLVAFEHGDIARGFIIGSLWNGGDGKAHQDNKGGKNNIRRIKSRCGHYFEFDDDTEGKKEKITIKSKAGARFVIDDTDGALKIELYDSKSENYLLIDQTGKKITLESKTGEIHIKAKDKIYMESKEIQTKSTADTKMEQGGNFKLNASSNMEIKAGGSGKVESGGTLTVKGSTVNIN
jgi:uncharacterized protein involved in type VI secretion and phage assembly